MTAADKVPALRWPLAAGALLALSGVMAGAFGAHGLRGQISARGLEVFDTAVTYQVNHSLALLLVTLLVTVGFPRRVLALAAVFFTAGVLLFSGSLYLLVLTEMGWPGPVTPVGGLCFMAGWALVFVAAVRRR